MQMLAKLCLTLALTTFSIDAPAIELPVGDLQQWTTLEFGKIAPNAVSVSGGAMNISVRSSASPLVYKLDAPAVVTGVTVEARWTGELRIPEATVQGESGADDFVLKLGVVEAGERTLNWIQRRVAANWIKQLFRLAPAGSGVERINFLSTTQQPDLVGSRRVHPLNELLYETRVTHLRSVGAFVMSHEFDEPVTVLGLWVSSDGDDTGSSFELQIDRITLHTKPSSH